MKRKKKFLLVNYLKSDHIKKKYIYSNIFIKSSLRKRKKLKKKPLIIEFYKL